MRKRFRVVAGMVRGVKEIKTASRLEFQRYLVEELLGVVPGGKCEQLSPGYEPAFEWGRFRNARDEAA